jgi:DNA methylase
MFALPATLPAWPKAACWARLSIGAACRRSHAAAMQLGLVPISPIVWAKTNSGMGSLCRSQHELLPLFKKVKGDHLNNIDLGRKGRWRSNLWVYPGASSIGSDARKGLRDHPTVKPTALMEDALLDVTARGDIVIDPFLGSGSTLIAAERAGRRCRGVEIDPLYIESLSGAIRPRRDAKRSLRPQAKPSSLWPRAGATSGPMVPATKLRVCRSADPGRMQVRKATSEGVRPPIGAETELVMNPAHARKSHQADMPALRESFPWPGRRQVLLGSLPACPHCGGNFTLRTASKPQQNHG